ncbi:MAG TPA: MarR family transcriptional regulator [Chloroflexia bacterium]|nr:MarR family transcriptional regulator [Chloroflexia bacterium]
MEVENLSCVVMELRILANYITKVAKADLDRRLAEANMGVSSLQFLALVLLQQNNYTSKELSRKLALEPATLVPVVDSLERQGLVERCRDQHDRRRIPLHLTESGRLLIRQAPLANEEDFIAQGLMALGPAKTGQLLALLNELSRSISAEDDDLDEMISLAQLFTLQPA